MYIAKGGSFSGVNLLDEVCGSSCANKDIDVEMASYLIFHKTKRSYISVKKLKQNTNKTRSKDLEFRSCYNHFILKFTQL